MLSTENVVDPPLPAVAKSPPPPAADSKQTPKSKSATSSIRVNAEGLLFAAMLLLLTIYT